MRWDWFARGLALIAAIAGCVWVTPATPETVDIEDGLWNLQFIPLDPEPAPAFTLEGLDGKRVSLADFRGRAILLYFFATW